MLTSCSFAVFDNRLVVFSEQIQYCQSHCQWLIELCQLDFEEIFVDLEEVEYGEFMGIVFHPAERRLVFIVPKEQYQFKPMTCVGSESRKLAINSRVGLASRSSFPQSQRDVDVKAICEQEFNRNYPGSRLIRLKSRTTLLSDCIFSFANQSYCCYPFKVCVCVCVPPWS